MRLDPVRTLELLKHLQTGAIQLMLQSPTMTPEQAGEKSHRAYTKVGQLLADQLDRESGVA